MDIGTLKAKLEVDSKEATDNINTLIDRIWVLNRQLFWLRTGWLVLGLVVGLVVGFVIARLI